MRTLLALPACVVLSGCAQMNDILARRDPSMSYFVLPNGGVYTIQSTNSGVNTINFSRFK